jgi:hypothetical protein
MPMSRSIVDLERHKWREVTGEPGQAFLIRHDYTILGYDLAAGTLDMLVRWRGDGGHCPIHRHTSTTTVLVLAGEQHLWDLHPDGTRGEHRVRRAGDYALTVGETLPHLERGGAEGGVVFFGNHSQDGRLYEVFDDDMKLVMDVTMELLVADWTANT